jgi:hypothetical protein
MICEASTSVATSEQHSPPQMGRGPSTRLHRPLDPRAVYCLDLASPHVHTFPGSLCAVVSGGSTGPRPRTRVFFSSLSLRASCLFSPRNSKDLSASFRSQNLTLNAGECSHYTTVSRKKSVIRKLTLHMLGGAPRTRRCPVPKVSFAN